MFTLSEAILNRRSELYQFGSQKNIPTWISTNSLKPELKTYSPRDSRTYFERVSPALMIRKARNCLSTMKTLIRSNLKNTATTYTKRYISQIWPMVKAGVMHLLNEYST